MENNPYPITEPPAKPDSSASLVFLSMAGFYILVCLCLGLAVFLYTRQIPALRSSISTPSPTPVIHRPASGDQVIKSDFSDNQQNWYSQQTDSILEIKDGKMFLKVTDNNSMMTRCNKCPYLHDKFYMEAEFSTDHETDHPYGLSFNLLNEAVIGYVFEINPVQQSYMLYELDRSVGSYEHWRLRFSNHSSFIKLYPEINKLGISFDTDVIELYINDHLVERYQDTGTDLTHGAFAFYMDDMGFELMVDNFFAYGQ